MSRWDEIIGHSRVVATLQRAAREGRPHHAYLLLGPAGAGKAMLASILAQALLCEDNPGGACGMCSACTRVAAGTHPDSWTEEPTGKSMTITSEQVGEIQRRLAYRRMEGAWRVVIVDGAGSMNVQAQNKLLKTLEEPPPQTILVLCALHPSQLLVTVRSRCQKLSLGPVPDDDMTHWLSERHGATAETARAAAAASQGLPGRALVFLDPDEVATRVEGLKRLTDAMGGNREAIDELVEENDRDREACVALIGELQELLRDAMVESTGASAPAIHPDARPLSGALASLPPRRLADLVDRVEVARERLRRNVHPGGVLEDLLVHLGTEAPRR